MMDKLNKAKELAEKAKELAGNLPEGQAEKAKELLDKGLGGLKDKL